MANFINSAEILNSQRSPSIVHFQFTVADVPSTVRRNFVLPIKAGTMIHSVKRLITEAFPSSSVMGVGSVRAARTSGGALVAVDPQALTAAQIEALVAAGTLAVAATGITYTFDEIGNSFTSFVGNIALDSAEAAPYALTSLTGTSASIYAPYDQLLVISLTAGSANGTTGVVKTFVELSNVKLDGIKAALTITAQAAE